MSNTFSATAGSPASAFEAKKSEVEKVISEEVMRSVNAAISGNSKLLDAAKGRFLTGGLGSRLNNGS